MELFRISIFVLCLCVEVYCKVSGCSLPLAVSDQKHLPVIVDNAREELKLLLPHLGKIDLNVGDKILLSCPNSGNTLNLTHSTSAEATCMNGESIAISNQNQEYEKVLCTNSLRGTALRTDQNCGGGTGYIIKLGFPIEAQFLTLIEVCYDAGNGNTLYTTHILYGNEIKYASKSSYRPNFSSAELAPGVIANKAYKQASQKIVFNKLLGSTKLAEQYINSKSFLTRGHLSPNADFLFASWRYTTFFYVNTIPQWQADNNGNWKKLEDLAKSTAAYYKENLRVYTGAYGVLSLPDINNVDTEIHLSNEMLAVPKFIWKILHSEISGKAIAFISLNNPFLTELKTSDKLCTDICDRYGWNDDSWSAGAKGFTYCCDARDLLKAIPTGPEVNVDGILIAPESLSRFGRFAFQI